MFTARSRKGVGPEKYDETAAAMIAQLKYGSGTPFYRLEQLEAATGDSVAGGDAVGDRRRSRGSDQAGARRVDPAGGARRGLHNDDTGMRVLQLAREPGDQRTGVFTSGIVSTAARPEDRAVLHRAQACGREHRRRAEAARRGTAAADPDVRCAVAQCAEAAGGVEILLANCLAHGRRQFVEVAENFPEECRYVLENAARCIGHDAQAREQGLTPEERLQFHQQHSGPVMEATA